MAKDRSLQVYDYAGGPVIVLGVVVIGIGISMFFIPVDSLYLFLTGAVLIILVGPLLVVSGILAIRNRRSRSR